MTRPLLGIPGMTDGQLSHMRKTGDMLLRHAPLPHHLAEEYKRVVAEQERRVENVDGAGI